jgi:hypothetical protein
MRLNLYFTLIFLISCSSPPQVRFPASESLQRLGTSDIKRSGVQIFLASENTEFAFYFYVQLKDAAGNYVDTRQEDFILKTNRGRRVDFQFERLQVGRYYLSVHRRSAPDSSRVDLYLQGKVLRDQFHVSAQRPHHHHVTLKLFDNKDHRLTFELRLADKKNLPVEVPETPEILIEGQGSVESIDRVGQGVWRFVLHYPEENQILYLGIRTMGLTFQNLYRYQHVEK